MIQEYHLVKLQDTIIQAKLFGGSGRVFYLETDGRKRKGVVRELIEAGYVTGDEDKLEATDKAYKEMPMVPVDMIAEWEKIRRQRRNKLDFVSLAWLSSQNLKYVIENKEKFTFYLCLDEPLSYDRPLKDGDVIGPIQMVRIPDRMRDEVENKKKSDPRPFGSYRYPTYQAVIKTPELTEHIITVLAKEKLEGLYTKNLKWGLQQLGVLTEEDVKHIASNAFPDLLYGDLGDDPEKWNREEIQKDIDDLWQKIETFIARCKVLVKLNAGVEKLGGWEVFKAKYKEELVATQDHDE